MNIFNLRFLNSVMLSLSFTLGITTDVFSMKRQTASPTEQNAETTPTKERVVQPAIKVTAFGEFRDPHAKKENEKSEQQLPVTQDDDQDTEMTDSLDDANLEELTKAFAAAGFFNTKQFGFLGRIADAVARSNAAKLFVKRTIDSLGADFTNMTFDYI